MLDLGTLQIGIKVNGDEAKGELNKVSGEVEKTGSKTDTLASKAKLMIKAFVAAYAIKEIAKLGKAALDAYAQFEQLEGGVNKIFGPEAAEQVMKNANDAYKTAGMSANQYMETVTNFSASLIQSMGGNTEAAAEVADMAIRDMSDNANTFGTNMQSIQDAYQGFAKQNYTMLDNLKLGYGGTKTEMERLLSDAEKLSGQKYDINNLNDVYEAIHVIQEEMNVTGTTSKEASKTIEGSMNALKGAWENMLTALGGGGNLNKAIEALFESAGNVAKNLVPRVFIILKNIIVGALKMLPKLVNYISDGISKLADMIGGSGAGGGKKFMKVAFDIMKNFVVAMIKAIPKLIGSFWKLTASIALYIGQNGPQLVEAAKKLMTDFVNGFLEGHPILQAAADAVINYVFKPLESAIGVVSDVVKKLHEWWEKLLGAKSSKKFTIKAPFGDAISAMSDIFNKWKDILNQKKKKTFEVAKKGFKDVLDKMKSIWSKWKDILGMKSKKTFTVERKGKVPSHEHRIGLREVPYDNYPALLHKGEAVMTAAEVNKMKRQGGDTYNNGDLTVNVYGSAGMSVDELATAVEKKIINVQKRRTAAWA